MTGNPEVIGLLPVCRRLVQKSSSHRTDRLEPVVTGVRFLGPPVRRLLKCTRSDSEEVFSCLTRPPHTPRLGASSPGIHEPLPHREDQNPLRNRSPSALREFLSIGV